MVSQLYDRVATQYDNDWSGLYASARAHCTRQIRAELKNVTGSLDAVDLGIGTGIALSELRQYLPLGNSTGFDVSRGMLTQAERRLGPGVNLIKRDIAHARDYLKPASADLALCHFLLSFVDSDLMLDTAYSLLRPGGLISLATSTQRSMSELHNGRFSNASRLFGVDQTLHEVNTPSDHDSCLEMVERRGFEIVDEYLDREAVRFTSFQDIHDWALDSGWVASFFDGAIASRIAFGRLVFALGRVFLHPLYPIDAVSEISTVLARKPVERLSVAVNTTFSPIERYSKTDAVAAVPRSERSRFRAVAHSPPRLQKQL